MNNSEIRLKIYEYIASISECWSDTEHAGIFDSDKAIKIAEKIISLFETEVYKRNREEHLSLFKFYTQKYKHR